MAGFVKGDKSANPNGRPIRTEAEKKAARQEVVLLPRDRKALVECIEKNDVKGIAMILTKKAKTLQQVLSILKEHMPYMTPKLQNIKSDVKEDKTLNIVIKGFDGMVLGQPQKLVESSSESISDLIAKEVSDAVRPPKGQ